ncbi:hypothetical protein TcasGA2_TC031562 [Tribolium castaneum]|uniref:Uncharacterized protein n=1 Tax=Tribolium castaneum TaxID=7070 RepID=A0A139WPE7_TRICA|nr:hypothetical protein TcasGA2_TC031562 [Tribolium castaneum]
MAQKYEKACTLCAKCLILCMVNHLNNVMKKLIHNTLYQ